MTADEHGNIVSSDQTGIVDRYTFRPKLVVKGEVGQQITGVKFEGRSTPYGPDLFVEGSHFLLALYRPYGPNRLIGTGRASTFFQSESSDQWRFGSMSQLPVLPSGNYSTIGTSSLERLAGVLVQAYELEPDPVHLLVIEMIMQRIQNRDALLLEFAPFYSATLEPRFLQVAGENPERKSRVLKTSAYITGDAGYQRFWQFFDEFDATTDPQARVWIDIPLKPDDTPRLSALIRNARTAAGRAAAIRALVHRASEEQKDIFISLLNDSNQQVRVAALLWLDQIQSDPRFKVKRVNRDTIANEDELIRYWQGR